MARSGHTVENPVTGHKVKFLKTAVETGGERLQIEYLVPDREEPLQYIPLHFHYTVEKRFETVSGCLGVFIGDKNEERLLALCEAVIVPPGTCFAVVENDRRKPYEVGPLRSISTGKRRSMAAADRGRALRPVASRPTEWNKQGS